MAYSAAVFDLDGTLLDTLGDLAVAVNFAMRAHGMPERSIEQTRASVGNGIRLLIERSVPKGTPAAEVDAAFDDFRTYYAAHSRDLTRPYPGVPEAVDELRRAGVAVGVVSNKVDDVVQGLLEAYFPGVFPAATGERAGIRRKPAPDSTLDVLARLGVGVEDAVYVGDSEVDIATAKNAGVPCLSVSWGFRDVDALLAAGATTIVATPEELVRAVLS